MISWNSYLLKIAQAIEDAPKDQVISLKSTRNIKWCSSKELCFSGGLLFLLSKDGNQLEGLSSLIKLEDLRFLCDIKVKDNDVNTFGVSKEKWHTLKIFKKPLFIC